jgi:flagellar protein FlbD
MIRLTHFDGTPFYVNATYIEFIEITPDTLLKLCNDKKLMVRESATEVVDQITAFYARSGWRNSYIPRHSRIISLDPATSSETEKEEQ